jgi:hypothetical protein
LRLWAVAEIEIEFAPQKAFRKMSQAEERILDAAAEQFPSQQVVANRDPHVEAPVGGAAAPGIQVIAASR